MSSGKPDMQGDMQAKNNLDIVLYLCKIAKLNSIL